MLFVPTTVENAGSDAGVEVLLDSPLGRFIARRSVEWRPAVASELFFRPENVDLLDDSAANGLNRGSGVVERSTFLGNAADLVPRCGNIAVRVRAHPGRTPSVGQRVGFSVDAQSCIVFPV